MACRTRQLVWPQTVFVLASWLPVPTWAAPSATASQAALPAGVVALEVRIIASDSKGIAPQAFEYLSRVTKLPINAAVLPVPRLQNGLKDGSIALAILAGTDERDVLAERLCEVGRLSLTLAVMKGSNGPRTLLGLKGKTYAMIRGTRLQNLPQLAGLIPAPVTTMRQGFSMLALGRVDAAICAIPGCQSAIRSAAIPPNELEYLPLGSLPLVIYATKVTRAYPDFEATKAALRESCISKDAQDHFADLMTRVD